MSKSSGRIKKLKNPLKKNLTDNTYRQAKPFLERETGGRCCYSMLHRDKMSDIVELIYKIKQSLEKDIPQIVYLSEDKRYMVNDYI